MAKIIKPPVEEARRLFEGKKHTKAMDVKISFIRHNYGVNSKGRIVIFDPLPPSRRKEIGKGGP